MNPGRPLLNPSQRWWDGSDGHAPDSSPATAGPGEARSMPPVPAPETEKKPAAETGPSGWDFSAAPMIPATAAPVEPAAPASDPAEDMDGQARPSATRPDAVLLKRAAVAVCVLLVVCLAGFGVSKWWTAHAFASARSSCDSAQSGAGVSRRRLERAMASAEGLDRSVDAVADPKTLEELDAALGQARTASVPVSCAASARSRQSLESAAARLKADSKRMDGAAERVNKARGAVQASRKERQVSGAQAMLKERYDEAVRLYSDSDGKVADNAARDTLHGVMEQAERLLRSSDMTRINETAAGLQSAGDAVRSSMDEKTRHDAAQATAGGAQDAPVAGGGVQSVPAPQVPVRPLPQQPSPQPQNPSRNDGWFVPAPTGEDTGLPAYIPGL